MPSRVYRTNSVSRYALDDIVVVHVCRRFSRLTSDSIVARPSVAVSAAAISTRSNGSAAAAAVTDTALSQSLRSTSASWMMAGLSQNLPIRRDVSYVHEHPNLLGED